MPKLPRDVSADAGKSEVGHGGLLGACWEILRQEEEKDFRDRSAGEEEKSRFLGERAVRAFGRIGFVVDHQTGSHMILVHSQDLVRHLTVPMHYSLKPGTLRRLIQDAGLTVEEFIDLL